MSVAKSIKVKSASLAAAVLAAAVLAGAVLAAGGAKKAVAAQDADRSTGGAKKALVAQDAARNTVGAKKTLTGSGSSALEAGRSAYVSGLIFDGKFVLDRAFYNSRSLMLKSTTTATANVLYPEVYQGVSIAFAENQELEGKAYQVMANQEKMIEGGELKSKPTLQLYVTVGQRRDRYLDVVKNRAPYRMTLNFYKQQNGLLPGFIDLEIQDPHVTKIKGYFWAKPL